MNNQFKQTPLAAAISGGLNLPADLMLKKFKVIGRELSKLKVYFETDEIQNEFWIYCSFKSRVIDRMRRQGRTDLHIFNSWGRHFVTVQTKRRADWFADSLDQENEEGETKLAELIAPGPDEIAAWRAAEFGDYEEDWVRRHTPEAIQARLGCCMKTAQNHFKRALETAKWLRKNPELFNPSDCPEIDDEAMKNFMWKGKRKYNKRGPDFGVQGSLI